MVLVENMFNLYIAMKYLFSHLRARKIHVVGS
jgi:hypothetical protein